MSSTKRSRARHALGVIFRRSGLVVGVTVTFVAATAAAVILHIDLPASRRLVATQATGILRGALAGNVEVEHIGSLGLRGVDGLRVRVRDPEGVQVLHVDDLRVRVRGIEAIRSALFGKGPIVIEVSSAWIGNVDVNLDADESKNLRLANAFAEKHPTEAKPNEPPGRGVRIEVPELRLGHAWAHGTPPDALLVDAELSELAAHGHIDPGVIRADLERVHLVTRALPRGVDPKGWIGGHFRMPAENGQGIDVEAKFDGDIGGMPMTAEARMNDKRIDARVDTRDPTGRSTNAMVSEVEIHEALSLHAEAHGDLPSIQGTARLLLGKASVDARVLLESGATTRMSATVAARHVDVSAVTEGAPRTDVGLELRGTVALHDSEIQGEASLETLPSRIEGELLPRVEVKARADSKQSAQLRARIYDQAMPTEVSIDVSPRTDGKAGQLIAAGVRARIPDLRRIPKVGSIAGGSATIDASAHLTLPERTVDADVEVAVEKLEREKLAIGRTKIQAKAKGTIDRLIVDAEVHSRQLLTGMLPFASVDASARIEPAGRVISIKDIRIAAVGPLQAPIKATAGLVRIDGPALRVDDVEVLGLGDPIRAELSRSARETRGKIDAPKIDLVLVARLMQQEKHLTRGTLGIQGEGWLRGAEAKGKVHIEARDVAAQDINGATALVDVSIDGRAIQVDAHAVLPNAAHLDVNTKNLVIGGQVTDPEAWKRVHGRVHLVGVIDMEKVASLLPAGALPVADLRGTLTLQGRLGRDSEDAPPEVQLSGYTNGLVVAGRSATERSVGGTLVEGPPSWRSSDVDLGFDLRNDGSSGFTGVSLRAMDARGIVIAVDAKTSLPYSEIALHPSIARTRLFEAPIAVKVVVPTRRLDHIPALLMVKGVDGAAEAELDLTGTVLEPRVHLRARARGARYGAMPNDVKADADVVLDYDGSKADLVAKVSSEGKELLDLSSHVEARVRDVILGTPTPHGEKPPLSWKASGRVRLAGFPLETIPQIAERRVKGRVSGEVTLDGLHEDARVKGRIDLADLRVGAVRYTKGAITVEAGGGKLGAKVRLDQKEGFLEGSASSGLAWGAQIVPTFDEKAPVEASLIAKAFRAAALKPFIGNAVPVFDGLVDAEARAHLVPGKPGAMLQGRVSFRDGKVQLVALGEEFRNVRASIALAPDGTIRVTDVYAQGAQGELRADASAKLDGMRLERATANIRIPDKRALDLALEGQPVGQVSGTIKVQAGQSADAKTTSIVVDAPTLNVELPRATKGSLQELEEKKNIRIGVYRDGQRFVKLPLDKEDTQLQSEKDGLAAAASRVDVDIRLGKVTIERGNQLRITLTGNPKASVGGGQTKLTGQIQVESGWLDVQGKKFEIEKGTVTFNGETPPNPVVVVTAGFNAADGSRVFADFVGPVKTGKVTLRSEPPRPKNEILALVLFGTADGANPRPPPPGKQPDGTTKAAVGLGGGFAAEGLTEALDDLTGIEATARIDTTRSSNPRPEVEFQVSRKVAVSFATVLGTPPITEPDRNLAKGVYRFKANWALQSTVGDRGTALVDAIWQKRY